MRKSCYALLGMIALPAASFAQQGKFADPAAVPAPVSGISSVSYVTVALVVVLAMVYGAAWVLRRLKTFHRGARQNLDVLEAVSVGPKERVVLLRVKDKQVLLGVAAGRVNMLLDLGPQADEPKAPSGGATDSNNPTATPNFKSLLKRSMGLS